MKVVDKASVERCRSMDSLQTSGRPTRLIALINSGTARWTTSRPSSPCSGGAPRPARPFSIVRNHALLHKSGGWLEWWLCG